MEGSESSTAGGSLLVNPVSILEARLTHDGVYIHPRSSILRLQSWVRCECSEGMIYEQRAQSDDHDDVDAELREEAVGPVVY